MTEKELQDQIMEMDLEYYTMTGESRHVFLPPGDVTIICNVLYDYANLLVTLAEGKEEPGKSMYLAYVDRLKRIRKKIEENIGYSTEQAVERCKRRNKSKEDDIGEDAMVLAVKKRMKKEHKDQEKTESN